MSLRRFALTSLGLFGGLAVFLVLVHVTHTLGHETLLFRHEGSQALRSASVQWGAFLEQAQEKALLLTRSSIDTGVAPEIVLLTALEKSQVKRSLRGELPEGLLVPLDEIPEEQWRITPFFDPLGRLLLTGTFLFDGTRYLVGVLPLTLDRPSFEKNRLLLLLADDRGRVLWNSSSVRLPDVSLVKRGMVERAVFSGDSWRYVASSSGSRVLARTEPIPKARMAVVALYPLEGLLLDVAWQTGPSLLALVAILGLLWRFWHLWARHLLPQFQEVMAAARSVGDRLMEIHDPEGAAMAIQTLSESLGISETRIRIHEGRAFFQSLSRVFTILARQQEEITAYNEEMLAMNITLKDMNTTLQQREAIWEKTLDVARAVANPRDFRGDVGRIASTVRTVTEAYGVTIAAVENDHLEPIAWSGYSEGGAPEAKDVEDPVFAFILTQRQPQWITWDPIFGPVNQDHPEVCSSVLIPLLQYGDAVGMCAVSFDIPRRQEDHLLDTLLPVASALGGFIHAERSQRELRASYDYLARKLHEITSIFHDETAAHLDRMGEYCRLLAEALERPPRDVEEIVLFAKLHDLGKLRVPHAILAKPGPLTQEEFLIMRHHAAWGADIIGDARWLRVARNCCLFHHERWDGTGYPQGLQGTAIPWEGQVVALADVYDALRSPRVYKPGFSHEKTVTILLEGDGRVLPQHFNPALLGYFREHHQIFATIFDAHPETGTDKNKDP